MNGSGRWTPLSDQHSAAARTIEAGEPTSISCSNPSHSPDCWRENMTTNRLADVRARGTFVRGARSCERLA
jgi:hypothetical protein